MRPYQEMTDEDLMLASRSDRGAFEVLVQRYGRRIFNFLWRMSQDANQAEDLYQDVFLRTWEARVRYRSRGTFTSWLFTIARNLIIDSHRSRRGNLVSLDASRGIESGPGIVEVLPADTPDPVEVVMGKERARILGEAIRKLPDSQREVLILARYHGMNYQQIGEITGRTPAAIKQMIYRAMLALKDMLADPREKGGEEDVL